MDLNVNSPSYYTQEYGIDDEIYWMCRDLAVYVQEKNYSEAVNVIGIVPIIAPVDALEKGLCKEHKKCEPQYGFASVSIRIDYEEYVKSDISGKKRLIINNILASVKAISRKGKINYSLFEDDIRKFCEHNGIII